MKTKYNEDMCINVEAWARRGMTDEEIMKSLGIARPTFYDYVKKHPNFANALKKGRETSIQAVENALFKIAVGYDYIERTEELDRKTGDMVETKSVTRHVQPNLGAQCFILKNRRPQYWQDKIENKDDERAIEKATDVLVSIKKVACGDDK